jgi:hypothetical protein
LSRRISGTVRKVSIPEVIFVFLSEALLAQTFSMLLDIFEALVTAIVSTKVWLNFTCVTAAIRFEIFVFEAGLAKFLIRELSK